MSAAAAYGAPLEIDVRRCGAAHVVTLRGAVGMELAEQLRERLIGLAGPRAPHLVLDLSGVTFISSIGITGLLATAHHCRQFEGVVRVASPRGAVLRVLTLMRLDTYVQIHPTLDEALASLPDAGEAGPQPE